MNDDVRNERRSLLGATAAMFVMAQFGLPDRAVAGADKAQTHKEEKQNSVFGPLKQIDAGALNVEQAVLGVDVIDLMDALKIGQATIGGFDWGARSACIVAALWPERCKALVSVSGYLIGNREA